MDVDAKMRGVKTPAKTKDEELEYVLCLRVILALFVSCSKLYEKYQESISAELKNNEKIAVEELLRDESIEDGSDDNEIIDREQERRENEKKIQDLKMKAERVRKIQWCLYSVQLTFFSIG